MHFETQLLISQYIEQTYISTDVGSLAELVAFYTKI